MPAPNFYFHETDNISIVSCDAGKQAVPKAGSGCSKWGAAVPIRSRYRMKQCSIDTDALGNVYVCGKIRNNAFFDNQQVLTYGGDDIFLAKYDCLGNLIWVEIAGSAQTTERATALVVNGEDIYLTGYKRGNSSQPFVMGDTSIAMSTSGFFLAKYDTSGNFKWVRADGGQGFIALGRDITQSWKNTIIVYGATTDSLLPGFPRNGSIFAAHFDYDGNIYYA